MFPSYYMNNSVKMANTPSSSDIQSSSATPVESKVDVLIIGAGPAGVMAANGLAAAGVDVRIVDKRWVVFRALCLTLVDGVRRVACIMRSWLWVLSALCLWDVGPGPSGCGWGVRDGRAFRWWRVTSAMTHVRRAAAR